MSNEARLRLATSKATRDNAREVQREARRTLTRVRQAAEARGRASQALVNAGRQAHAAYERALAISQRASTEHRDAWQDATGGACDDVRQALGEAGVEEQEIRSVEATEYKGRVVVEIMGGDAVTFDQLHRIARDLGTVDVEVSAGGDEGWDLEISIGGLLAELVDD